MKSDILDRYLADELGIVGLQLTLADAPVFPPLEHVRLPVRPRERGVQVPCTHNIRIKGTASRDWKMNFSAVIFAETSLGMLDL